MVYEIGGIERPIAGIIGTDVQVLSHLEIGVLDVGIRELI
jgi:hypothetical protein